MSKIIRKGLSILNVENPQKGISFAHDILGQIVNKETALFLSGGSTPKTLYELLSKEKKLFVGAVGMVDERLGKKMHKNSNERMIKETGLLSYLERKKIPFYPILRSHLKGVASDFVKDYDKKVRYLLGHFSKSIAIMGIGEDGHTAGLPSGIKNSKLKIQNYVVEVNNFPGEFKERITLTFKALSKMDLLIILAFGENKKEALKKMFGEGSLEEVPARFYTGAEIAVKTLLITDQKI